MTTKKNDGKFDETNTSLNESSSGNSPISSVAGTFGVNSKNNWAKQRKH